MRRSKYAALALLITTVGPSALQAAEGFAPHEASVTDESPRVTFKKPSRAAERRTRVAAERMGELIEHLKQL